MSRTHKRELRAVYFLESVKRFQPGGSTGISPIEYRARLIACQNCRWREIQTCPVIECGCKIASYAVFRANSCPQEKWPVISPEPHPQDRLPDQDRP